MKISCLVDVVRKRSCKVCRTSFATALGCKLWLMEKFSLSASSRTVARRSLRDVESYHQSRVSHTQGEHSNWCHNLVSLTHLHNEPGVSSDFDASKHPIILLIATLAASRHKPVCDRAFVITHTAHKNGNIGSMIMAPIRSAASDSFYQICQTRLL